MEFGGFSGSGGIVVSVLVGLALMGYGAYSYSEQSSALDSAVEVTATIDSTSVERSDVGKGVRYHPRATFDYIYEGETYTSSNVYPGELPRDFGKEEARSALEEYEPGDTVTAYVPPDSPGDAFLEYESSNKPFLVIGVGGLVFLGSVRSFVKS